MQLCCLRFKQLFTVKLRMMKKLKYLFAAMAMVASISLISCSSEDDPKPELPEKIQPLPPTAEQPLPETPVVTPY